MTLNLICGASTDVSIRPSRKGFAFLRTLSMTAAVLSFAATTFAQSTERVLHNFTTREADGSLISDSHGNLYGTTGGLRKQYGTVFEMRHLKSGRWTYKLLYRFNGGSDGAYPRPGLVFDTAGNLYGTTLAGGVNPCNWTTPATCGTVFQLTPTPMGQWAEKVIYNFPGAGAAAIPSTGLISDSSGNFYGATTIGGQKNAPVARTGVARTNGFGKKKPICGIRRSIGEPTLTGKPRR